MKKLKVPTQRGVLLDGVLFGSGEAVTHSISPTAPPAIAERKTEKLKGQDKER